MSRRRRRAALSRTAPLGEPREGYALPLQRTDRTAASRIASAADLRRSPLPARTRSA